MESRALAAFLSTFLSLLFVLSPLSLSYPTADGHGFIPFSLLHHHFLSSAAAIAATHTRKRRRSDPTPGSPTKLIRVGPDPGSFRVLFNISGSTFEWLAGLLEPLLECRDPVGVPLHLNAETRLGIGLHRLANGSGYPDLARRFRVTEWMARFCCKQLCRVLCTNFRFWVGYPSRNELELVSNGFETLTGLSKCCGVIDCARFRVRKNPNFEEEMVAAQIVVDSSSRILSIIAGFNGEKSNLEVLRSSSLCNDIEGGSMLNSDPIDVNGVRVPQYLIGGNGYPLLPWLMVPFLDANPGSIEERFNETHRLMRVSMRKTVASLRNWGILSRPIEGELRNAVAYIGACAILHNALLMREDYSSLCCEGDDCVDMDYDDCSSRYSERSGREKADDSVERKACDIRSALAGKVKVS